ncbi:MAG: hypothetical protein IPN37_05815 [Betaproteobacteria bacterium]|jgi:hypothetical protein|nr:hypothetical protein [Betaproteobacteria bacterium]
MSKASAACDGRGPEEQTTFESPDCAADADQKHVATAVARAALLGIEARRVPAGAWLLRHAHGADIGIVHGTEALEAAVRGFESARDDMAELVRRIGGAR